MKKVLAVAAATLFLASAAQAVLVGRDINGNAAEFYISQGCCSYVSSGAPFIYDTVLDITWLRDAHASDTGLGAQSWVSNLTVGQFGGWRLPTLRPELPALSSEADELGHLLTDLGVGHGPGPFNNLFSAVSSPGTVFGSGIWSGTKYPGTMYPYYLDFLIGTKALGDPTSYKMDALAVRPGDVLTTSSTPSAVPEPAAVWLMASGLGALGVAARKRRAKAA